jgi:histidinol-phosphate phosphatase family protein
LNSLRPALFLDRDGTINIDYHYIKDPGLVELFPGAAEAIKRANEAGFYVAVVTNQSGVNRGLITREQLDAVHVRLQEKLNALGAHIDSFEICIHAPSEQCECRKPKSLLLTAAAKRVGLALPKSYMVGDRLTDIAAGKGAGCQAILVKTGNGQDEALLLKLATTTPPLEQPNFVADDLLAAVGWILQTGP